MSRNPLTETAKAHRPMPTNAVTIWAHCVREARRRVGLLDTSRDCDLDRARKAWATLALAAAISPKHASAFLRRNRNHAAALRCGRYMWMCDAAEAFGVRLVPVWDVGERRAA